MKRRFLIAVLLGSLVATATVFAATPTGQDRVNGARSCKTLRTAMGDAVFKQTYGTPQSNFENAFGKCVSRWAHTELQARVSARAACTAEQNDPNFAAAHGGKTFQQFYGTGPKGANAFGRCVSSKARASVAELRQDTVSAARQCRAERAQMGVPAFRAEYGLNRNDRNAFGKCVSKLAKEQND
jgi:hypothetical protein